MSEIRDMLTPGERIVYETQLSQVIFTPYCLAGVVVVAGCMVAAHFLRFPLWLGLAAGLIVFLITAILPVLTRHSSEFAVTTKRVIMKTGIFSRSVFEMRLEKIESIDFFQALFGRMFNYGDVTIHGTGNASRTFHDIAFPDKFKNAVLNEQENHDHGNPAHD